MITKQHQISYCVGEESFKTLDEAKRCELKQLLPAEFCILDAAPQNEKNIQVTGWLMENSAAIVDILTTTARSHVRSRKLHGGIRKRKTKSEPAAIPTA